MESFSNQWFTAYYLSLGSLLISYGIYLFIKRPAIKSFLIDAAQKQTVPAAWKTTLKYFLLFTIPGLILSFFPFSWVELLFSLWSLMIIYVAGQIIMVWSQASKIILQSKDQIDKKIRYAAVNMISIGIVLFLLAYLIIDKTQSGA